MKHATQGKACAVATPRATGAHRANTNTRSFVPDAKHGACFALLKVVPVTPPGNKKQPVLFFRRHDEVAMGFRVCLYSRHQDSATITGSHRAPEGAGAVRTEWVDRSQAWDSTADRSDTGYARRLEAINGPGKWLARTCLPALVPLAGKAVLAAVDFGIPKPRSWRGSTSPMGSQPIVSEKLSGRLTGCRAFARELRDSLRTHRNSSILTALSCEGTFSDNAVIATSHCHGPSARRMARKRGSPAGGWRGVKKRRFVQR
jgi:hypothetical protein